MKKIVLTGGGTAGHVTPNLALLPTLNEDGWKVSYIGSKTGIERGLITEQGVDYYPISSGKLRRYFDFKNFTDPFRILAGCFQAFGLLGRLKPDIVFSKGGFVSVPVVLAARFRKIPVIIHESDISPGLANKIAIPSASRVCCNFPETLRYLPKDKALLTGSPIRRELLTGDKATGLSIAGFPDDKPVIMVIGGSTGAKNINNAVREALPTLLRDYRVIHLCGAGMLDDSLNETPGYVQYEYVKEDLRHLFAAADVIISRAGANSIIEILALQKPHILIPLPLSASRGDQILNAKSFKKQGFSYVLHEDDEDKPFGADAIIEAVNEVYTHRETYIEAMKKSPTPDAVKTIYELIKEVSGC
ncbi:MAG: undecaprenyldiphospho-muramoylpentapeptide beta-N-acetylglucosaminyltransferase [Eubacterium sp.]|nr:undecaprenyldiphospho-muramoylpentapeptide beta-N-acetylglucosaminyltransferase [Eubacterium sp.]